MSSYRVTQRALGNTALHGLQGQLGRLGKLQEQLSSGRLITRASDSPTGTVVAMQVRSEIRSHEQYVRNASDAIGWLGTADQALTTGLSLTRRARDLTLQGMSTGTMSPAAREALATEVDKLRESFLGVANTQYLGRPIFGGTTTGATAYDATGTFVGDTNPVARTVGANTSVPAAVNGPDVFGTGTANMFTVLGDIAADLRTNPGALGGHLDRLDAAMNTVLGRLGEVGARYSQVDQLKQTADDRILSLRASLSDVENVDLPKTVMELQLQQVAYQAALGATSKVVTPSLVDFLR